MYWFPDWSRDVAMTTNSRRDIGRNQRHAFLLGTLALHNGWMMGKRKGALTAQALCRPTKLGELQQQARRFDRCRGVSGMRALGLVSYTAVLYHAFLVLCLFCVVVFLSSGWMNIALFVECVISPPGFSRQAYVSLLLLLSDFRFRFRFIRIVARRLKITKFTSNKKH